MKDRERTFLRNTSAGPAVEFAAVLPVLLVMALGLVDAGIAIAQKMRLNDAALQGAHYGLVRNPIAGDLSGIRTAIGPGEPDAGRNIGVRLFCECSSGTEVVCTTVCPGGVQRHRYLDINLSEVYTTIFHYPVLGSRIPITSHVVTRLQ